MSNPIKGFLLLILIAGVSVIAGPAWGQLYQYTDSRGNIVFTDTPPAGSNAEKKELRDSTINWSNQVASEGPGEGRGKGSPPAGREETRTPEFSTVTVEMYMTDWCGYCKKAGEYVRSLGANLVEYNIDKDLDKKDEMRRKSGGAQSVPLLDIHGTIIRGYSPALIKSTIERVAGR